MSHAQSLQKTGLAGTKLNFRFWPGKANQVTKFVTVKVPFNASNLAKSRLHRQRPVVAASGHPHPN